MYESSIAKLFKAIVLKEKADLVLLGKQSIDGDNNQTGQLLAGLLSWPQATFASAVAFNESKSSLTVNREVDTGIQVVSMSLPAVVTTDLRLNTPRFATLPNLMKAKKKPLEVTELSSLNVDVQPRVKVSKMEDPPARKGGRIVGSVDELVHALKNEAKVV